MEIILGLDIGDIRTGMARSDSAGIIVSPIKTIETKNIINEIKKLAEEFEINKIIIGLPKNMDGSEGERVLITKKYAENIKASLPNLEIIFEDERLSSEAAIEKLKDLGIKITQHNKDLVDMHAAAIILEQYFGA